ncbi:MAG TPA: hypothetical protein VJN96_00335 [Vicinamibacterales bacterium]|nr:hypothetical protein [Vicinamibacterales bacterium]
MAKGDIDISRIPASGIGGLGLLAMAGITVYFVPQLRAVGIPTVLGGVVIGLTLVAIRNRRVRTLATIGAIVAAAAFVAAVIVMLRGLGNPS